MYHQQPHRPLSGSENMSKINDLVEQLKNECANIENDLNVCKMQRDDYERKLEAQLNEFTNMKQTIFDLEMNYQNLKQHYEEEILRLRRKIDELQSTSGNTQQTSVNGQTQEPSVPQQGQTTPSSPFLRQLGPPMKKMRTDTTEPYFPPPTQTNRNTPPPIPGEKRMDNFEPELTHVRDPNLPLMTQKTAVPSFRELDRQKDKPTPFGSQMAMNNTINTMNQSPPPQISSKAPMSPSLSKTKTDQSMVKREGNDWVVVYNPQVKTNVNINLFHNLEHQSVVCCVRFSNDGKYLATGCNKLAQIFNTETGAKVRTFPTDTSKTKKSTKGQQSLGAEKEDSYIRSVCFSPDGEYLVAGAEDKTVKVWNINSGILQHSFVGHELDIYSLDFSPDNRFIVSGSGDGKAKIWNMETGKCEHTLGNDDVGPKEGVTSVAISPDGRVVAAGSLDCVVRLWDVETGQFLESFKGHEDSVYSVAFSPDGKTLASGSLDKTLKLWDLVGGANRTYRCIATLTGHRDYVLSVAFSPDGKWLVSGSKDRSVQFWDPRSNVLHLMLQGHKNSVISVALNPKSQMFATGSGDCRARIWKYDSIVG
jgi:glucose repression regulatory protein TUP1